MTTTNFTEADRRVRESVTRQLNWDPEVEDSAVGVAALTGMVNWIVQKERAEKAVRHIQGVHGVRNHIDVRPHAAERDVRHRIVEALHRNADLDARHISVAVAGAVATLSGTVRTWLQRDAAGQAAAHAPGITEVDNRIVVEPPGRPEVLEEIC